MRRLEARSPGAGGGDATVTLGAVRRRMSRRSLLGWSALGGLAIAASGCQFIPGLMPRTALSVWTDATAAPEADAHQSRQIAEWARNERYEVTVTREAGGAVRTMLQEALAAGQAPDLSQVDGDRYALLLPTRGLTDVTDLFGEIGLRWQGWYPVARQLVTRDGRQFATPYSIDGSLLLYWSDVLRRGGVREFPTDSWRTMVDALKRLMEPPDVYGFGLPLSRIATDAERALSIWALAHGASVQRQDSRTLGIKTPETRAFLEEFAWSWDQGIYPPGTAAWDNARIQSCLQDRRAIVIHTRSTALSWFRTNRPEALPLIGVAASPRGLDGRSYNVAGLRDGFAVMATGRDAGIAASRNLVRHLYDRDVYRTWIELTVPGPALDGLAELDIWQAPLRRGFLEVARSGIHEGYPGEPTSAYAELRSRSPWQTMATRVVADRWTPDQAMDEMERVATEVYARHHG